jgi:hypothetical protein
MVKVDDLFTGLQEEKEKLKDMPDRIRAVAFEGQESATRTMALIGIAEQLERIANVLERGALGVRVRD